jgi:hypothetical protein
MFEGWLEGAVAYARPADDSGTGIEVREVACSALGAPHCEFQTSIPDPYALLLLGTDTGDLT